MGFTSCEKMLGNTVTLPLDLAPMSLPNTNSSPPVYSDLSLHVLTEVDMNEN